MKARSVLGVGGIVIMLTVIVPGMAPITARAEPELTEANPAYGDVLETLPEFLHLCFTVPVKVEDSKDWRFNVATPEGKALGIRIVFDPSGGCVDVYPGAPQEPPQGIWTFDWLVHAQADGLEGSGVIKFQLGKLQPGETPLDRPDSADAVDTDGGGASPLLVLAVAAGAALVIAATVGFALSRRRRA